LVESELVAKKKSQSKVTGQRKPALSKKKVSAKAGTRSASKKIARKTATRKTTAKKTAAKKIAKKATTTAAIKAGAKKATGRKATSVKISAKVPAKKKSKHKAALKPSGQLRPSASRVASIESASMLTKADVKNEQVQVKGTDRQDIVPSVVASANESGLTGSSAHLRLWDFRWVRDLFFLALAVTLVWLVYTLRALTLPVIIGLTLAYLFNPVISYLHKRWQIRRQVIGGCLLLSVLTIVVGLVSLLSPVVVQQVGQFAKNREAYQQRVDEWRIYLEGELNIPPADVEPNGDASKDKAAAKSANNSANKDASKKTGVRDSDSDALANQGKGQADDVRLQQAQLPHSPKESTGATLLGIKPNPRSIYEFAIKALGIGYHLVSDLVDLTLYLIVFVLLTGLSFFYFSWRFQSIVNWVSQFVPSHHAPQVAHIAKRMDAAVFGFVRGRAIQSCIMMVTMSLGLFIVDAYCGTPIPSWLVIGIAAGCLNIVPYAALVAWLAAVFMAGMGQPPDDINLLAVIGLPTLVYAFALIFDTVVVEPFVQGKAVQLNALAIVLAVLVGGSLGGIIGVIIAIPSAACLKIMWEEVWSLKLKGYLESMP
jgi:predicted PurR-regulated permease PerM